jgi:hypothetical protein
LRSRPLNGKRLGRRNNNNNNNNNNNKIIIIIIKVKSKAVLVTGLGGP